MTAHYRILGTVWTLLGITMIGAPILLFLSCRGYQYGACEYLQYLGLVFVLPVGIIGLVTAWLLLTRPLAARWLTITASLAMILLTLPFTLASIGLDDPWGLSVTWILRLIGAYGLGVALLGRRQSTAS